MMTWKILRILFILPSIIFSQLMDFFIRRSEICRSLIDYSFNEKFDNLINYLTIQEIRIALRGKATVLMGKNTMMRKAIRDNLHKNPDLEK